ncbi:putative RNA methyltransferase [Bhargavaea cecembensis]|uniref:putative RNA methyltransferase n=1 Tax=Bhargavaea cecembensis TaxID=394098 RepID=UPI00058B35BB|nr:methyltransferase domain-containing protein [Bhargavaea cecembensis]
MNRRMEGAESLNKLAGALRCPVCGSSVSVDGQPALACENRHSFDLAKQGYVNLLSRQPAGSYSKELFESRRRIITGSGLYDPLHEALSNLIRPILANREAVLADIGCGEGSHLHALLETCGPGLKGAGLDIAKEGIIQAARNYPGAAWIVGDLAASPFADGRTDIILNLLSPSNYGEFKRMLAPGGMLIKVIPGSGYLKELREALHGGSARAAYSNEETAGLFERHFKRSGTIPLRYEADLDRAQLADLARMTPLGWSPDPDRLGGFLNRDRASITVELDILIGEV